MTFKTLATHDPNAVCAYRSDWTAYFVAAQDSLDHAVVEIVDTAGAPVDSDLEVVLIQSSPSGVVTYHLRGGTPGLDYIVRVTVFGARTTPIRIKDCRRIVLPVRQK